jgi:metal-responsive CopG/Arc/MetJ family transcriptional regulator
MAGYRSERMVNITATLPIPLLEKIDQLVREGKVQSRSRVIREAVRDYLKIFQ